MSRSIFQYQGRAEPLFTGIAPEDATLDKWQPEAPAPVRRPVVIALLVAGAAFVDVPAPAAAIPGVDSWGGEYPQPQARRGREQGPTVAFVRAPEAPAVPPLESWLPEAPDPPARRRGWPWYQELAHVRSQAPQVTPSLDSWTPGLEVPIHRPRTWPRWAQALALTEFSVPTPPEQPPAVPVLATPAVVPVTRNRRFLTLPDIGTLALRTDRLTGAAEARLKAPAKLEDSYTLTMPMGLPGAPEGLSVDSSGNLVYEGPGWYNLLAFGNAGAGLWTKILNDAIEEISTAGGGFLWIPRGTYDHEGITLRANVKLFGAGRTISVLNYTPTTGDGITLAANPDSAGLFHLRLRAKNNSTGWAVNAPNAVLRQFRIEQCDFSQFTNGYRQIVDAIDTKIYDVRFNGRGKTIVGSIACQFGISGNGGNKVAVRDCYFSSYETLIVNWAQDCVVDSPQMEYAEVGVKVEAGPLILINPWFGGGPGVVTTDVELKGGVGFYGNGYGSQSWKILYTGGASDKNRSVIIPERLDITPSTVNRGVRFGRTMIYNEGSSNTLSMGKDDRLKFRDSADADGSEDTTAHYRDAPAVLRTPSSQLVDGRVNIRSSGASPAAPLGNTGLAVLAGGVDERKLVLQAASSPTFNLAEFRANNDTVLSKVDKDGKIAFEGGVTIASTLNLGGGTTKTIAAGVITITHSYHRVDTESAAATDDLDTINGGVEGDILYLRTVSSARDVVLRDSTGNIRTASGVDLTLSTSSQLVMLLFNGTNWIQPQ